MVGEGWEGFLPCFLPYNISPSCFLVCGLDRLLCRAGIRSRSHVPRQFPPPAAAFPNRTAILFGCIALALVLASTAAKLLVRFYAPSGFTGLVNFLDMDKERNLPSFFSAGLLFLAAQLLFLISRLHKGKPRGGYGYWLALAIIFLYMTFDEAFSVHEPLSSPIKQNSRLGTIWAVLFRMGHPGHAAWWPSPHWSSCASGGTCPAARAGSSCWRQVCISSGPSVLKCSAADYVEFHVSTNLTYILLSHHRGISGDGRYHRLYMGASSPPGGSIPTGDSTFRGSGPKSRAKIAEK